MSEQEDNEFAMTFAKQMVEEVTKFVEKHGKKHGGDKGVRILSLTFLASYCATLVYKTLNAKLPLNIKSDADKAKYVGDNFNELKAEVQNAVAAGFQGAMNTYAGKHIEYYCLIKVVPKETGNKLPC